MDIKELRKRLNEGKVVIGTHIMEFRVPSIAQIFSNIGYNFLIIDCEHGFYNMETVADITRVARNVGIVPMVRVAEEAYHLIARYLDSGIQGIIIPRVEERKQIEKAKEIIRYAPLGKRGVAPGIANNDYIAEDVKKFRDFANKNILLIIQIESEKAVKNLDEIIKEGNDIDVICVGPVDMSFSINKPGQIDSPEVKQMIEKVFEKAKEYNIPFGFPNAGQNPDINAMKYWIEKGSQFIWVSSDLYFISQKAKEIYDFLTNKF